MWKTWREQYIERIHVLIREKLPLKVKNSRHGRSDNDSVVAYYWFWTKILVSKQLNPKIRHGFIRQMEVSIQTYFTVFKKLLTVYLPPFMNFQRKKLPTWALAKFMYFVY